VSKDPRLDKLLGLHEPISRRDFLDGTLKASTGMLAASACPFPLDAQANTETNSAFADHLGPCMATSRVAAEQLLREFLARSSRETLIVDCIKSNPGVVATLASFGFVLSRPLTRMVRGPNVYPGRPDSLWAILGPEFG